MMYIVRESHIYEQDMFNYYVSETVDSPFMNYEEAIDLRDSLRDELSRKGVKNVVVDVLNGVQYPGARCVEYKLINGRWTLSFGPGADDYMLIPVLTKEA